MVFWLSLKWTKWKKTDNKELFSFCSWKLGGTVERRAMYMFIFTLYYPGVEHHSLSVLRGRLVVCGGNRWLSSCISWQRPETSWTHFANLRFHTNWKLPEQWTYSLREGFTKKSCCSFGFCPNEGGGRALPKFCVTFSLVHFWSITRVNFLQMPIIWTLNCFLGCTQDPQCKYSAFI